MDKRAVKVAKKSVARIQKYQRVFSGPEGQEVLDDLIRTHHVMSTTFDGDPTKTIFREGERNVVLRILGILKMDSKILQERIKSHENDME
jgi:hypothetical protein